MGQIHPLPVIGAFPGEQVLGEMASLLHHEGAIQKE